MSDLDRDRIEQNEDMDIDVASEIGEEAKLGEVEESSSQVGNLEDIFLERSVDLPLKAQVEAVVFASPKPVLIPDIISYLPGEYTPSEIEAVLLELQDEYEGREGGFTLEYTKGIGYQFRTVSKAAPIMELMFSARPKQLSKAALETLAIIAYRQPTTRAVVEFIRGVDSGSIIKNLMERNFIKCVGRKEDIGRPMLFGTTDEFLQVFGISSIEELPSLQSFQSSSDVIEEANKKLEDLEASDQVVHVEKIVGDGSSVEVSEGLLSDFDEEDDNKEELDIDWESSQTGDSEDDEGSQSEETKMDFSSDSDTDSDSDSDLDSNIEDKEEELD